MFDGIIFDVDGTLWDACDSVIEGWNQACLSLTGHELPAPPEEFHKMFGKTMEEIARAIFPAYPPEQVTELGDACFRNEIVYLEQHPGQIYDGVPEMMQELSRTYPLYIVSNCQFGYIEILLKTGNLGAYISDYMCYEDTNAPKSVTIRELMKRNSLHDVLYIGDTQGDAAACRDAGVPFLFAEYGLGSVTEPYPSVSAPSAIPQAIAQLEQAR